MIGSLEGNEGFGQGDYFLMGKDFPSYIECQEQVDEAYRDQKVSYLFTHAQGIRTHILIDCYMGINIMSSIQYNTTDACFSIAPHACPLADAILKFSKFFFLQIVCYYWQ